MSAFWVVFALWCACICVALVSMIAAVVVDDLDRGFRFVAATFSAVALMWVCVITMAALS